MKKALSVIVVFLVLYLLLSKCGKKQYGSYGGNNGDVNGLNELENSPRSQLLKLSMAPKIVDSKWNADNSQNINSGMSSLHDRETPLLNRNKLDRLNFRVPAVHVLNRIDPGS